MISVEQMVKMQEKKKAERRKRKHLMKGGIGEVSGTKNLSSHKVDSEGNG